MNVDDGVDLVGALRRLIDSLRVASDDALGLPEEFEEADDVGGVKPGRLRGRGRVAGDVAASRERVFTSKPAVCCAI
jgi:hypothetical protein